MKEIKVEIEKTSSVEKMDMVKQLRGMRREGNPSINELTLKVKVSGIDELESLLNIAREQEKQLQETLDKIGEFKVRVS